MSPQRKWLMTVVRNPAWVCLTWFGMTAGVSLLATPARFAARVASRADVLDVSRHVFSALNKAEFVALILLLIVVRVSGRATQMWAACAVLALILFAQALWLIPELSMRTDLVIAGDTPGPSNAHAFYSVLELAKLLLLLYLGFQSLRQLLGTRV